MLFRSTSAWNFIIDELIKRGYTPLQFGLSKNPTSLEKTVKILDIPLRILAACYYHIGNLIALDSGDHHLMLSVGGKVNILHPPSGPLYNTTNWHYTEDLWKGELCRAKYYLFDKYKDILNNYL